MIKERNHQIVANTEFWKFVRGGAGVYKVQAYPKVRGGGGGCLEDTSPKVFTLQKNSSKQGIQSSYSLRDPSQIFGKLLKALFAWINFQIKFKIVKVGLVFSNSSKTKSKNESR